MLFKSRKMKIGEQKKEIRFALFPIWIDNNLLWLDFYYSFYSWTYMGFGRYCWEFSHREMK